MSGKRRAARSRDHATARKALDGAKAAISRRIGQLVDPLADSQDARFHVAVALHLCIGQFATNAALDDAKVGEADLLADWQIRSYGSPTVVYSFSAKLRLAALTDSVA